MKKAIYKVPNGKLLKVFLEDFGGKIVSIKITGDFFMHPEENIENLENALKDCELKPEAIASRIEDALHEKPTTFFGLDTESLVKTILTAAQT
ncbi:hypothetical protein HZC21_06380 [Candidatus Peregrinibacteria bacterium]|nr:hypothetical protein [Candidatus Peregrinibacteria bacterium]